MIQEFAGFLFVTWLLVSIGVWWDATTNSPQSRFLWGLAVLIGGPPVLIIYFLLGRDSKPDHSRTDADSLNNDDLIECPNCRALEERTQSQCRFCNTPINDS